MVFSRRHRQRTSRRHRRRHNPVVPALAPDHDPNPDLRRRFTQDHDQEQEEDVSSLESADDAVLALQPRFEKFSSA
jgi:hypothetical protein